jgi:thiamine biosynthesis protein ThiI
MAMKRGCEVTFVTFHSHPFIGDSAKRKVVDLVRVLARHQGTSRLFVVPFAHVQLAVREVGRELYRTVMYRRFMQRIASRIAAAERAQALITGESIGQVASQTLENMACINAAASLPVLRPLVAFDKSEIVGLARRIGTYDISCVQEPDCCTLFTPPKPVIRGRAHVCEAIEADLDVDALVSKAHDEAELIEVDP